MMDETQETYVTPAHVGLLRKLKALHEHLTHQPLTYADRADMATIREAIAALSRVQEPVACAHNCDEGGICLAELSGYPESCPEKALEPIDFDALGDVLAQYPDSTPITEVEELSGLSVGGLTVLAARAATPPAQGDAAQPGAEGWRTMDSAPKDGTRILVWPCHLDGDHTVAAEAYWYVHPSVQGWVTELIDCGEYDFEPTRWMPLPASPAASQEGGVE